MDGSVSCFFFFKAEDGIRDYKVTGVQTCALPIWFQQRPCSPRSAARLEPEQAPPVGRRTAGRLDLRVHSFGIVLLFRHERFASVTGKDSEFLLLAAFFY